MEMWRSTNPVLSEKRFAAGEFVGADRMTVRGTFTKAAILTGILLVSAAFAWRTVTANPKMAGLLIAGGAIAGFILALIMIFKRTSAPYLAPVYAVCEGLFLGPISAIFEAKWANIVLPAVSMTLLIFVAMLVLYTTRLVQATPRFVVGVIACTAGIALVYLASIVMSMFGMRFPMIHDSGPIGIGFSLFVCVIAALNFILDFDLIERGAQEGMPRFMEWYGAFALLVTLVWLYIEILDLLRKLRK